jgi:hypothetical protein
MKITIAGIGDHQNSVTGRAFEATVRVKYDLSQMRAARLRDAILTPSFVSIRIDSALAYLAALFEPAPNARGLLGAVPVLQLGRQVPAVSRPRPVPDLWRRGVGASSSEER